MIKVYGGTQPDKHLCRDCAASIIRKEKGQEVTVCREMPGQHPHITGKVTECSSFTSITHGRTMSQLQGQAWHLDMGDEGEVLWTTPADRQNPPVRLMRLRRRANPRIVPSSPGSEPGPTVQ